MIELDTQPRTKAYVLQGAPADDIEYVATRLRESDKYECAAFGIPDNPLALANLVGFSKDAYTAHLGREPAFIFGTIELLPGVRQLFGFGTPKTKRVMPAITWFTKTYWLPEMKEAGVRRIQVHVPRESPNSLSWLKSFGMVEECEMKDYAANGAAMLQLAFSRSEFSKHVFLQQEVGQHHVC